MGNINKALLVPMLAFMALLVKTTTGKEIPNDLVDKSADVIMGLITIVGFFMHPSTPNTTTTVNTSTSSAEAHPDTFIQG